MNYEEIEEIVKNTLSEKRFNHSKGVAKRAAELASMYGEDMETLNQEFEEIQNHDFKLYFEEYPDKEKQKEIFLNNQDVADKDVKALGSTKVLIDKLTEEGGVSKLQLMQELFGMSKEELLKELTKKTGGE